MTTATVAAILLCGASPAQVKQAADLAHRSMAEYDAGLFDEALQDAQAAYVMDPRPGLLFNIAQVHRAMHHWERAAFNYRRYLAEKKDAPNRADVEKLIAEMQGKEKEEAAAKSAPPPVAPVIVEAPAPPPAPAPAPAPASAVTAAPEPKKHGHGLGIGLASAGGAMVLVSAISVGLVVQYNNSYGGGAVRGAQFSGNAYNQAKFFNGAEWVAGILGVAGITAAVFTW